MPLRVGALFDVAVDIVAAASFRPAEMPLALPGCEPTNWTAMLERHRPRRLRDRHAVLGAVVGHITDLEATIGQWANRSTRP